MKGAKRLYLARHGETLDNARGISQGWADSALSPAGIAQVAKLAERMRRLAPTSIYSSTLPRAVTTAETIAAGLSLPVRQLEDLREMSYGRWEGLSFEDVRSNDSELYRRWSEDVTAACPGGESFHDVQVRTRRAFELIQSECEDQFPLIVAHGTANRILLTAVLDLPLTAARMFAQDNAALNIFDRRGGHLVLRAWNDTTHC